MEFKSKTDSVDRSFSILLKNFPLPERKIIETELNNREKGYQDFVNMLPLVVFETDEHGNLKFVNDKGYELFGYSAAEFKNGFNTLQLLVQTERGRALKNMVKNINGEKMGGVEYLAQKKNGDIFPALIYSLPILSDGKAIGFRGVLIDITDRKKREVKLKESEEKYRILTENSDDLISLYDEKYRLIYINTETHSRILGYPAKKFLKASFKNIIAHKDDVISMLNIIKKGITEGNYKGQIRFKHHDGYYLWFQITAKFFSVESKKRKLLVIARDITDIKQTEIDLKESKEKFRTIAEQAFMGIAILQQYKLKYVNSALLEIFELSHKDIEGWTVKEMIRLVHPEDLEFLKQHRRKLSEKVPEIKNYYSYRALTKYGKLKWIDQFSKNIFFEGEPAELITVIDITEKKKAEEELIKLNNLKSELFVRTSHELKTPLISIKGFSDLLLTAHRSKLDQYSIAKITAIKNGADRLQQLIGDILKAAELESGYTNINKKMENLTDIIYLSIDEARDFAELRNHELVINVQPSLITNLDREKIQNIISNLLNNAIKYTPPYGIIEIKSEIRDNLIVISIKDDGVGFTTEEKRIIFKQFGKIERYGQNLKIIPDGTGLGLFISKKLVELHGGEIWVQSEGRNQGTTVNFTVPLTQSK